VLRYDRQAKPGLVTLYDIWPGNGADLFLQPRRAGAHMGPLEGINSQIF